MDNAFVGTIIAWPIDFEPRDWAFCDGRLLSITDHQILYAVIGTAYGGDGRVNFALPDLRGRTIIGNGVGPGTSYRQFGQRSGSEYVDSDYYLPEHTHLMPNLGMSVDISTASFNIVASEMTVNSSGTYGVPITSESNDATGMPSDSEHYLGTPKLSNGSALNTYYKSNSNPTVTTKATEINVSAKVTPTINASISGDANVSVQNNLEVSKAGYENKSIPLMQPSLTLNYIICLDGIFPSRT